MGKVCLLITAGAAIYSIGNAENKQKETIRQGTIIGAGIAAGWAAGLTVSAICEPAAPVCASDVVLAGSVIAGSLANEAISYYDHHDEEPEEFTRWGIR